MPYLFIALLAVAIAAFASPQFSVSLLVCIACVTAIVKLTATRVIGPISFGAAARSVAWAALLPAIAIVTLLFAFDGKIDVEGMAAVGVVSLLFVSFVLGFKLSLGATFAASAVVALVSTLVAAACFYVLRPLLF